MTRQAREWLQLNVALTRSNGSALPSARFLIREIEAALLGGDPRGSTRFFFQRKNPDLRLRFYGNRQFLMRGLRPVISRAKSQGCILKSFYSVYEPEQRQLGGRECMRHVHAYWAADSLIWIARDRLAEANSLLVSCPTLMASVLDDLFCRTLQDGAEVWDTWCNLGMLVRNETADRGQTPRHFPLEVLKNRVADEEADIVVRYQQANDLLSTGLLDVWQQGKMRCGIRSLLPYVALFTLNRHGFGRVEIAAIVDLMSAIRDPKQGLIGAEPDRAVMPVAVDSGDVGSAHSGGRVPGDH